jgi:hypothetical protein
MPSGFFDQNPGIDVAPGVNKASKLANAGGGAAACCSS